MPKKTSKNSFYYFMVDFKKREERAGRSFPNGLRDVQADTKCNQEWANLPAHKKKEYTEMAKDGKIQDKAMGKQTGIGESVELIKRQQLMLAQYEENMKSYIDQVIEHGDLSGTVELISFYLIHVNYFYTKVSLDSSMDYIPAEFAVVEFTLNDGVKRCYHQMIQTSVEVGFARELAEVSDKTHRLVPDWQEGEKDFGVMYTRLIEFLKDGNKSAKLPPIYTTAKLKTIVPCLLRRMLTAAKMPESTFDLYSLEYLFGSYIKYLNTDFPENINRSHIAEVELSKDAFTWTQNIACSYHSGLIGSSPYCSQSIVYQWVYTFCDFCCPRLEITMLQGVHCPHRSNHSDQSLSSSFASLNINEARPSRLQSETGVTEAYRQARSARTHEDEQRRKKEGAPLTIIDHSQFQDVPPPNNTAATSETPDPYPMHKHLRPPKTTIAKLLSVGDRPPPFNEEEFPSIGRGKPKKNRNSNGN